MADPRKTTAGRIAGVLSILVATLCVGACAPAPDTARTAPAGARVVTGGDGGGLPRAEPDTEQMDAAALAAAWEAARASGARAVLVIRHGHLVFERYRDPADAEARVDGGAMSATVLALLAGVARAEHPELLPEGATPDMTALQSVVTRAAAGAPEAYLAQQLWRPLDAGTAWYLPAADGDARLDCCLRARATDWLRVGLLLLDQGRDRGEQRVPAEWVDALLRPQPGDPTRGIAVRLAPRGYAVRNLVWLPGGGGTRLWLSPALQLAVLRVDNGAAADAPARDAEWLDPLLRAVRDHNRSPDSTDVLDQLVPGH